MISSAASLSSQPPYTSSPCSMRLYLVAPSSRGALRISLPMGVSAGIFIYKKWNHHTKQRMDAADRGQYGAVRADGCVVWRNVRKERETEFLEKGGLDRSVFVGFD